MSGLARGFLFSLFVAAFMGLSTTALADVIGVWLNQSGDAHVEIVPCGDKMCGRIIWLEEPFDEDGNEKLDKNNPDQALRPRKILGLQILSGFTHEGDGKWKNGRIYSPKEGKTYKCTMALDGPDRLKIRGYVGISLFGKTEIWIRVR